MPLIRTCAVAEDVCNIAEDSSYQTRSDVLYPKSLMATSLPILMFHSLDDEASALSFPPLLFRQAMATLHRGGYRTLSLLEAVECLRQRKAFPDASFVITFDDGYQTVYREAFPALQEFGFKATLFVSVGEKAPADLSGTLPSIQNRLMLSWHELREMHRYGMTIGSHSLTHPDLTRMRPHQIEDEVCRSKKVIEETLSAPVNCFAFPYGSYDRRSLEIVRQHYDCACSTRLGTVRLSSDPYTLERIETYYFRSARLFGLMLSPLFPLYLQARRIPRAIRQALVRSYR